MGKKIFAALFILAIGGWVGYYFIFKKPISANDNKVAGPLKVGRSSDIFTASLQDAMTNYFALTAAFVEEDSAKTNAHALLFSASVEAIDASQLKADTTIVALVNSLKTKVQKAATQIPSEIKWDEKRQALQTSSNLLFDMLRTVQYKGGKVYQQFCPMAFDYAGANWLSENSEIRNPYFGDKMLECGEVRDSIQY